MPESAAAVFRRARDEAGSLASEIPYWGWLQDGRTCLTRRGELVTVGGLVPRPTAGLSHEQLSTVVERWVRLLGQLDSRTRLSLFVLRRPLPPAEAGEAGIAGESARARAAHLSRRLSRLEISVAWARDPRLRAAPSANGTPAWLERGRAVLQPDRRPAWIRSQVEEACEQLRQDVDAHCRLIEDLTPIRILEPDEATRILNELVNRPGTEPPTARGSGLHWRLAQSELEAERRQLRIDGEDALVYSLVEPPSEAAADQLRELLQLPATMTVSWEFRRLPTDKARKRIDSARKFFFAKRFSMMAHARDADGTSTAMLDEAADTEAARLGTAQAELEADGMPYGDLALGLTLHGPLEEIERHDAAVRRIFASCDAKIIRESYGQLAAYFARLPGAARANQPRPLLVSAGVAAALAPLCGPTLGSPRSAHLDEECLCVLETREGTPYHYDLFAGGGGDIGHTLILGQTGSGKSFLLNFLLVSAVKYGPRVFILDLGGSYRPLTQLMGGDYLQLSPDPEAPTRVRPFSLPPGERTFQFLAGWVRRLLELGGYETTGGDTNEIRKLVEDLYRFDVAERRLGSLAESLLQRMKPAMSRWVGNGTWGAVFDNPPAEGAEDAWGEWQVVDLASAAEHDDLVEAALGYYLEKMRHEIDDPADLARVKIAVVDEAWKFLKDPSVSAYLAEAAKTWRKKNAALLLATQSGGDLARAETARGLLEATPTRLFLANPEFPLELAEAFQLSPAEVDQIRGLVPKHEIYLRRTGEAEVLRLEVDQRSYWLYTSSARDAAKRARAIAEHGLSGALDRLARGAYRTQ